MARTRGAPPPVARAPAAAGVLVVGTTSDAGKSFLVAGLCRLLTRRGWTVQPFKAVNLSLNSAVAEDGGEIAIAQWVQCRAARVPPRTCANPVLLKAEGPGKVEVIVRGRTKTRLTSWSKQMPKQIPRLREEVAAALEEARQGGRFLVAEGAGSPVEVNLRSTDLSNFEVARALDAPVILVADLERGGAVAQIVGTLELLEPEERRRVKALVLNRMRGDARLLEPAVDFLRSRTGVPVLGVLPYWTSRSGGHLPEEDALSLPAAVPPPRAPSTRPRLGILRLPHASNFSDFRALGGREDLEVAWVEDPATFASLDALLLPGSRRTREDLLWMHARGIPDAIRAAWNGGRGLGVAGVCGGYQMLGRTLEDPLGFEGPPGASKGLGLLHLTTRFEDPKVVRDVKALARKGHPWLPPRATLSGYEVRRGRSSRGASNSPLFELRPVGSPTVADGGEDGACRADGSVWGTGLHGILTDPLAAQGLARWVRSRAVLRQGCPLPVALARERERGALRSRSPRADLDSLLDEVADLLEAHLDLSLLAQVLGRPL